MNVTLPKDPVKVGSHDDAAASDRSATSFSVSWCSIGVLAAAMATQHMPDMRCNMISAS